MAERVRIDCSFETRLSPERCIQTLTDFSERRPAIWPNIDPDRFELHESGESWAVATEGSREPPVWARERYEWGPDWVTIKALESNFCVPGDGTEVRVSPADGGGSRVELIWEREPASPDWQPVMDFMRDNGEATLIAAYGGRWDELADVEG